MEGLCARTGQKSQVAAFIAWGKSITQVWKSCPALLAMY